MRPEILPLTSLRFIAALWVFLFHIEIRWPLHLGVLDPLIQHGAVGMSLFFMLSGFVLGYSFPGQSLSRYARNRFARIYPVYTLAAVVTLPFLAGPSETLSLAQGLLLVLVHLLMLQAWFPSLNYWNFAASWSLSVEAFFYALFPFIFQAVNRLHGKPLSLFFAVVYCLSVLPGVIWLAFRPAGGMMFYSMPIFRLPEFLLGVGIAVLYSRGVRLNRPGLTALTASLLLGGFLLWLGPRTAIYVTANVVAVPMIALLIFSLAQTRYLAWRPLVVMGRASYAFYSMQALVILTLVNQQKGREPWDAWPVLAGAFLVLSAISLLTYYLVEEPARRFLSSRTARRQADPAARA